VLARKAKLTIYTERRKTKGLGSAIDAVSDALGGGGLEPNDDSRKLWSSSYIFPLRIAVFVKSFRVVKVQINLLLLPRKSNISLNLRKTTSYFLPNFLNKMKKEKAKKQEFKNGKNEAESEIL
jgi:hypothetical protein